MTDHYESHEQSRRGDVDIIPPPRFRFTHREATPPLTPITKAEHSKKEPAIIPEKRQEHHARTQIKVESPKHEENKQERTPNILPPVQGKSERTTKTADQPQHSKQSGKEATPALAPAKSESGRHHATPIEPPKRDGLRSESRTPTLGSPRRHDESTPPISGGGNGMSAHELANALRGTSGPQASMKFEEKGIDELRTFHTFIHEPFE